MIGAGMGAGVFAMLAWIERNTNSTYYSFMLHIFLGFSRLKNTSFFPFMLMVCLGALLGMYMTQAVASFGISDWQALLLGFSIGFIAVSILFWVIALGQILLLFPFPRCEKNKCHRMSDYRWSIGTIYGWEAWGVHRYWCSCGDEYVRHGRRFMRAIYEDDTFEIVPYKRLVGFRKWADDEGGRVVHGDV